MSERNSEILLQVSNLEIQYGAAIAVRGVDLVVKRGELVSIIGNNGAGKTSILRGISGLVRPRAGRVTFKGEETANFAAHQKVDRGLALVPEGRLIFADQTVEDNLILGAYGRWNRERKEVLRDFDQMFALFPRLKERLHQSAGSLSGGEQQMLAVARGLVSKPDLLMIDEMSLGLAPKIVARMMTVLRDLNAAGQTILLVEQLAAQALAIADRAYVVDHGKIELEGRADELADSPAVMEAFLGKKRNPVSSEGESK
jgi:branched-chain amino acid transport system ATP-binding protein